jgi:excisionase family DNA binding protein
MTFAVYLTFPEACEYARINRNKMRVLLKTGKIPSRKVGRTWVVPRASIDAFMSEPHDRIRLGVSKMIEEKL